MLRSAQPSQFSTYPSQYIDTPVLAVLMKLSAVCRLEDVFWLALKVQDISCFVTILSYYLCNNSYHVTGISIKRGLAKEAGNQGI